MTERSRLRRLGASIRGLVSLLRVKRSISSSEDQVLRVDVDNGEDDDLECWQSYGFASRPHAGAEGIALSVGGHVDGQIVILIEDRRHRPTLVDGEAVVYNDSGMMIRLIGSEIQLGTGATAGVGRVGDRVKLTGAVGALDTALLAANGTGGTYATGALQAALDAIAVSGEAEILDGSATVKAVD